MEKINASYLVINLMSQDANFQLNKKFLYALGLNAGFLLTYLIDQYKYLKNEGKLREDDSFFKSNMDASMYTTMKNSQINKCKKLLIEKGFIKVSVEGTPPITYYYINFQKILELLASEETNIELASKNFYGETIANFRLENEIDLINLQKLSFIELRSLCKETKTNYDGKDIKLILMEKLIQNLNPNLLDVFYNLYQFPMSKKTLINERKNAHCDKMTCLDLSMSKKMLINERNIAPNQEQKKQEQRKNHDHEEHDLDFEKIFHELGVNYTKTNRESIKKLLQKMHPYQVEQYLRELYKNIKENPEVKNINALFSRKIQRQEYQINTPKETTKTEPSSKSKVKDSAIIREKEELRKKEEEIRKKEEEEIKLISIKLNNFSKEEKTRIYELAESKVKDETMKKSIDTIKRLSGEGRIYLKLIYKNVKEILEKENFS